MSKTDDRMNSTQQADAPNPAMAPWFHVGSRWCGVGDPLRLGISWLMRKRAFSFILVAAGGFVVCAIYLHWRLTRVSLADLPYLQMETYQERKAYRVDPYIQVAHRLQAMGKEAACDKLLRLSLSSNDSQWIDDDEKIAVLCRMLFTKRAGADFRRPELGATRFPGGTDYSDWPLEPIEIVDGIPFAITTGYSIHGGVGPPDEYLRYCMTNCDWSDFRFMPKTDQKKKEALAKLLESSKWRIPLHPEERGFFGAQIQ